VTAFDAFVRSAPLALVGSVSARVHELSRVDEVLRRPMPVSRRIGVVQARGGAGASTTAGYVAALLARRRPGLVLGVDASRGTRDMLWHAGVPAGAGATPSSRRRTARRSADAVDGLPRTPSGLWALDLDPRDESRAVAPAAAWFDEVTPISRFFELVVTDWGVRDWRADLGEVVSASRTVCIVARADRHAAEEAAALVPAVKDHPDHPDVVIALVDVGGAGRAAPTTVGDDPTVPVVRIPHDPRRGSSRPVGSAALGTRTRIAYARLAAALMPDGAAVVGAPGAGRSGGGPTRASGARPDPGPAPDVDRSAGSERRSARRAADAADPAAAPAAPRRQEGRR
jgi:MinD-like ATPase involved in chromosome partitioning or flagellar assembly